eukprot:gene573-54784_t
MPEAGLEQMFGDMDPDTRQLLRSDDLRGLVLTEVSTQDPEVEGGERDFLVNDLGHLHWALHRISIRDTDSSDERQLKQLAVPVCPPRAVARA